MVKKTSRKIFCIIIFPEKGKDNWKLLKYKFLIFSFLFFFFFTLCLIHTLNNVCYLVCNVQCIHVHLFSKGNPVSPHLFSNINSSAEVLASIFHFNCAL